MARYIDNDPDGVGTALSSYIRKLEQYPPLSCQDARRRAQELDVAKCPLYLTLWLGGYNYLSKEYRGFVNTYYPALQAHIPATGEDSHPDPLTLQDLHGEFVKLAAMVDQHTKRTREPAHQGKFTKAPARPPAKKPTLKIALYMHEWRALGQAREATLPPRIHAILSPAAITEVTANLQVRSHRYKALRDVFALHNMRLVIHIASKHNRRNETYLMDFIQEGNKGLLRAIDRFCHWMGHKFSTYATWWIRQQISRYIQENTNTIRIPSHITDLRKKINRFCENYYDGETVAAEPTNQLGLGVTEPAAAATTPDSDGDLIFIPLVILGQPTNQVIAPWVATEPSNQIIADHFHITVKKLIDVRVLNPSVTSMDAPLTKGGDSSDFASLIPDPTAAAPEQGATMLFMVGRMKEVMAQLSAREQSVLQMRFGLGDGKQHTLQEVGRKLDITRERVRQIEQKALKRLRHPQRLKALNGDPFLASAAQKHV